MFSFPLTVQPSQLASKKLVECQPDPDISIAMPALSVTSNILTKYTSILLLSTPNDLVNLHDSTPIVL